MTAQDAAVVTLASIALERSERLTVAREAAEPGEGQPPPAVVGWEGWPDRLPQLSSVSADLSMVTVTRAASHLREGGSPQGSEPSPAPHPCRLRGDPEAGKLLFLLPQNPSEGSVSPHPPPGVTTQSLQPSAVLLFSLHGEAW